MMDNISSFTVVSLSYEDARLEFFRAQREAARRRMEYWKLRIKPTTTPMHPEYHNVTEAAEHWNYYNDIVEMLEAGRSLDNMPEPPEEET